MACGNILQDCPKTDSPAGAPIFFLFLPPNSVGFMDRGEGIYHILALTAVAIWGTTFVSTKLLLAEGMTPAEIMFYRFLIAYLALKLYKPTFRLPESWRDEALFCGGRPHGRLALFSDREHGPTNNARLERSAAAGYRSDSDSPALETMGSAAASESDARLPPDRFWRSPVSRSSSSTGASF